MRFRLAAVAALSCCPLVATLIACGPEEYPNPPANPNGVGATTGSSDVELPPPSDTGKPAEPLTPPGSTRKDAGRDASNPVTFGATSGISPGKALGSLSAAEKKQFCDWQAGTTGGYGHTTKCEGGVSTEGPKSQSACVQRMPSSSCAATIAEAEACIKLDAQDPCAFAILTAPQCKPLRDCAE